MHRSSEITRRKSLIFSMTKKSKQSKEDSSSNFYIKPDYEDALKQKGLTSIEEIFTFVGAKNLVKENLAPSRSRIQFEAGNPAITFYLKRYDKPPRLLQLKNWLTHRKKASFAYFDFEPAESLRNAGINTPQTIAFGDEWGILFETRSFCIVKEIAGADAIERKLPDCFYQARTAGNFQLRRDFIRRLAQFIKKFHQTGYRHRDLYFSHIFYNNNEFYLIDLARAFVPQLLSERFRVKDIAQLFYSAPKRFFSYTDRMRFYLEYNGRVRLNKEDKIFIRNVVRKAQWMARHDTKHGRSAPFAG